MHHCHLLAGSRQLTSCCAAQGQYARVIGYMEPLNEDDLAVEEPEKVQFTNEVFGNAIPPSFLPACEKGFREACNAGALINYPVEVRVSFGGYLCRGCQSVGSPASFLPDGAQIHT